MCIEIYIRKGGVNNLESNMFKCLSLNSTFVVRLLYDILEEFQISSLQTAGGCR